MSNLDRVLKNRDITLPTKSISSKLWFSSGYVWMWKLDHKESWVPKNWFFWIVVLEKTLESPSDSKEIQPVHPKGSQPWTFIGRTDTEAEAPILWPPDVKSWLTGKDSDAEKDGRSKEKGAEEDEMVRWHHDGQWGRACCSPWDHKESNMTKRLNLTHWTFTLCYDKRVEMSQENYKPIFYNLIFH